MFKFENLLFLLTFIIPFLAFSQDFEIYKKEKNDNYILPQINPDMSYEEFQLLSQNVRMKDMFYAGFVPGYIHFKAQEKKKGYWLLGIRSTSYAVTGFVLIHANNKYGGLNNADVSDSYKKMYQNLLIGSASVAISTYLYDVIHGDYLLHEKQEKIRYKYALKLQTQTMIDQNSILYPTFGLTVNF